MTIKASTFEIGKTYSFDTYAPEVLNLSYSNVKIIAIMDADTASRSGVDIEAYHERVRPHLPVGYNKDPYTQTYIKFRAYSGKETVFSMSWINLDTLMQTEAKRIIATIDDVSMLDMDKLRQILVTNGYNSISLNLVE